MCLFYAFDSLVLANTSAYWLKRKNQINLRPEEENLSL